MSIENRVNDFIENWELDTSTELNLRGVDPETTMGDLSKIEKNEYVVYVQVVDVENYAVDICFSRWKLKDRYEEQQRESAMEKAYEQSSYQRNAV